MKFKLNKTGKEYNELTPEEKIVVDAYGECFPETFKEIMDDTINISDFFKHLIRYEGFKAGWKARGKTQS